METPYLMTIAAYRRIIEQVQFSTWGACRAGSLCLDTRDTSLHFVRGHCMPGDAQEVSLGLKRVLEALPRVGVRLALDDNADETGLVWYTRSGEDLQRRVHKVDRHEHVTPDCEACESPTERA